MNLEDIRLKTITPPPGDKVSQWHLASFGYDRRVRRAFAPFESVTADTPFLTQEAPLPPIPPSQAATPVTPAFILHPASESVNQQTRPVILPSAPATEQTPVSLPQPIPQSPVNEPEDASSMGTERPASALDRAKDLEDDEPQPNLEDIPLIPSSPSKSTAQLQRNFTINDKDLRELLSAATDHRQDKAVRDALKRAARERIDAINQLEKERQQEAAKAQAEEIPPWAVSIYELLHQTHDKLETLNIRSPEASRVGSPSPAPQAVPIETIHSRTFSAEQIPHTTAANPTSHPMQHSSQPMALPVGEYEPYSAPYQEPYPMVPPSHYSETKKAASTVALPPAAPVDRPPTEPALPAASPPGEEYVEHHIHHHHEPAEAATPKPAHVDHVYIHQQDEQHPQTHIVHEYIPSPPMPVAPQTTPAMEYREDGATTIDGSVSPNRMPVPDSTVGDAVHHIHHLHHEHMGHDHLHAHANLHDHDHDHSHGHGHVHVHDHAHEDHSHLHHHHQHHEAASSTAPYANHPWENIRDRLNAWADLWNAHASPNQLELAKESTHLTRYVSMIACDIFCTQVYKRWVRTIGARYPPVPIDKLFLPPSFAEVLNSAVSSDMYANTAPTFRSFWHELGFPGAPKQLLTLALYRTDRYHFQVLKFDLEGGVLTHYDPFDAPALLDPRPKLWWRGLREAFPEVHIPDDHKLQERVVAINRPKPHERSDSPLAALASWRHMLVNKKPNKETDLMAVRSLIAAEIEGVQKVTDRRTKQRAKKVLQMHN
ncbi:hypothetical protein E3P99_01854 [Wallemia hederae]|uniref:Uncharacterized protein n=1 Tax=Wallemia hederae TaxID=1540922 RepID=A0A4V4LTC8_9BASI|nr:hypothetical protein E3P99_01854 [Wallemia hederae]